MFYISFVTLLITLISLLYLIFKPIYEYKKNKKTFFEIDEKLHIDISFLLNIEKNKETFDKEVINNDFLINPIKKDLLIENFVKNRIFALNELISIYERFSNINLFSKSKYYIKCKILIIKIIFNELELDYIDLIENDFKSKTWEDMYIENLESLKEKNFISIENFFNPQ